MQKKRVAFILSILMVALLSIPAVVFADKNNFQTSEFEGKDAGDAGVAAGNVMTTAVSVIRIVGAAVSIIMLSYMGIKYMMSAPSERAEFKKSATIFVVGAILVFGATQILGVIFKFADSAIVTS